MDKITLRHTGQYYDMVNALDGAVLLIDQKKYSLPISKLRISQNYIEGQNLIFEGNIYKIDRIDTAKGEIAVRLASGGNNDETVEYIQDREYIAYLSDGEMTLQKSKHIIISSNSPKASSEEKSIRAEEIFLDTVSFPMEVVTKGYYLIDPNTMTLNYDQTKYLNIFEGINERICKQVYRRYGYVEEPFFSTDDIVSETELNATNRQAQALILKIKGSFGEDSDRLSALAGVMLNETLKMIYPSIADCIAVCPIYRDKETITSKGKGVLAFYPDLIIKGDLKIKSDELAFMIIEDCQQDAGLLYSLTESGDDILNTIFRPIRDYLEWLKNAVDGSRYLYFGMDKMPYYYDHIPDRLKPYYDVLFEAAKAHQTEVEFTNAEKDDIFNAMKAMRNDHPELFWVNQITAVSSVENKMTATVDYGAGKDEIITLQQRLEEAVKP